MDAEMARRWTELVAPDDEIWIDGDLVMGNLHAGLELVSTLPGRKFLVPGNHDRCWPGRAAGKKLRTMRETYESYGVTIVDHAPGESVQVGVFNLCHFPPTPDRYERREDRFSAWRTDDRPLLHGHTHSPHKTHGERDVIHVGVDAWDFYPVSETQLLEML